MEEEKYFRKQRTYKTIMLVILTIFLTFIVTTIYITNKYNLDGDKATSLLGNSSSNNIINSISNIKTMLKKYYLKVNFL